MISRLETRCFATSVVVHAALAAVLLLAPGFRRPPQDLLGSGPPLELVPGELLDAALAPGPAPSAVGVPDVQPTVPVPASPPARVPPAEAARPQEPEPEPVRKSASEDHDELPISDAPGFKVPSSPVREKPPTKPKKPEREPASRFDLSKAKPVPSATPRDRAPSQASERETAEVADRTRRQELARNFANAAGSLEGTARPGSIRIQLGGGGGGGGGGGSTYAWQVRNAYHNAWTAPQNVRDDLATVDVEVVIRRDGRVTSARILKKSGISALDRSVQAAIDRVREVAPFEAGTSDVERSFSIGFNLRGKRSF